MRSITPIFVIVSILVVLMFVALVQCSDASWEELPEKGQDIMIGGMSSEKATALDGMAIHAGDNYWIGVQGSRVSTEDITHQEFGARAQGGFSAFGIAEVQGFIEVEHDMIYTHKTGFYFRKVAQRDKLAMIFGAGSLIEGEEAQSDLGVEEDTVLPYWLAIVGAEYNYSDSIDFYAKVIGRPELNFGSFNGDFTIGIDIAISDTLTMQLQSSSEVSYSGDTFSFDDTENRLMFSLNR